MMQTANMEKQGCTIPCRIITQTFGLFHESSGCTRLQQRGNGRFRARWLAPPAPACSDFFDFPQICAMRPREVVFFWLKEGRQGDLRQRNAIDAGRPTNVQR